MLSLDRPQSPTSDELTYTTRILIVEDEELIREMIVMALQEQGYDIVTAADGHSALSLLQSSEPTSTSRPIDLMILDLMLPQINGLDICRLLRYQGNTIPILILSAKASETDRVLGLEVGADDYLTKPFSMQELVARCRALIRRQRFTTQPQTPVLQFRDISLSPTECRVMVRDREVNLSPKEFRLLELFLSYPRRVWSREHLIERVWGADFLGDTKTVDVHIRWLREKLEDDPSKPKYIVTVRGFGYRFG
jgi:two-component system phosphate regulon response regulator PhoB